MNLVGPCKPSETSELSFSSKSINERQHPSYESSLVAAGVLNEWIEMHWQIDRELGVATALKLTSMNTHFNASSVDDYSTETASLQAALL